MDTASLIINMALAVIFSTIKNPQRKLEMKAALLKLRNAINMLYAGDPDFD